MSKILMNNEITDRSNLIDIEDRGYQFGDGIYEVIGVYNGVPLMMAEHLVRLSRSAKEIKLNLTYSIKNLEKKLLELIKLNQVEEGIIYLQVSRGIAPRWHEFPNLNVPSVTVAYTREEDRMTEIEDNGAKAILTEDIRWLRCDIKTLNLLPNVLAKQKAVEENAIEAILHRGDIITEASTSNVFIVKNGEVLTHPATEMILNGITRQKVLQICKGLNLTLHEKIYTIDDLINADEVFITATRLDIVPILKVDDYTIKSGQPGTITKAILQEFRSVIDTLEKSSTSLHL